MRPASHSSAAEADQGWSCRIIGGPNAGAVVPLPSGRYRVGSALSNDIILADAGVATEQALLDVSDACVAIDALADGARLGRRRLRGGARRVVRTGSDLTIGATRLRLMGPPRRRPKAWMVALPLLAGAPCIALALNPGASVRITHAAAAIQPKKPQAASMLAASVPGAVVALRTRLATDGLASVLHVKAEQGAVLVAGTILTTDRNRWHAEHAWFDGRFGSSVALLDRVSFAAAQDVPHLQIRAVSMTPVPYLITASGDRYMEGAVLQGGWTIARIASNRIVLRRDGREIDVTL